jgi:hypothetical protein
LEGILPPAHRRRKSLVHWKKSFAAIFSIPRLIPGGKKAVFAACLFA